MAKTKENSQVEQADNSGDTDQTTKHGDTITITKDELTALIAAEVAKATAPVVEETKKFVRPPSGPLEVVDGEVEFKGKNPDPQFVNIAKEPREVRTVEQSINPQDPSAPKVELTVHRN